MNAFLIALLLQFLPLPPRMAMENPSVVSQVPQKLKKDYDKMWSRFLAGKEDAKLVKDLDKLLKKQRDFDAPVILEAYIELYKGSQVPATEKFEQALAINPKNRIALYYLAELASARRDYARASDLYSQLLAIDKTRAEIETKRQKALLLATEDLLRSAERAEQGNRLAEAEGLYRQALKIAPNEPTFHARFAELLAKQNKPEEAAAENRIAQALQALTTGSSSGTAGGSGGNDEAKFNELEDLGRWGKDIESFRKIQSTDSISREQFAAILVRYFPQLTEFRQSPQIVTDIQDSWARPEIQTIVGVGIVDPLPNHTFEPSAAITRGDFALSVARLIRLLSLSPGTAAPIPAPDLAPTNAQYRDIQLVLGYGLMTLADSGNFSVSATVSGGEAVRAAEQLLALLRKKQA